MKPQHVYAGLLAILLSAGCASNSKPDPAAGEELEVRMGVVEEVRQVPLPSSSGGYIGAIGGSGVGGIAGMAIENSVTAKEGLEITVRLDSGRQAIILQSAGETFRPGERVRVISGSRSVRVSH